MSATPAAKVRARAGARRGRVAPRPPAPDHHSRSTARHDQRTLLNVYVFPTYSIRIRLKGAKRSLTGTPKARAFGDSRIYTTLLYWENEPKASTSTERKPQPPTDHGTGTVGSTENANHGEARSADAASWRGTGSGRRRRSGGGRRRWAPDPFRTHTTSHAHTARPRAGPLLTSSSS